VDRSGRWADALTERIADVVPGPRTRFVRQVFTLTAGIAAGLTAAGDRSGAADLATSADRVMAITRLSVVVLPALAAALAGVSLARSLARRSRRATSDRSLEAADRRGAGLSVTEWVGNALIAVFLAATTIMVAILPGLLMLVPERPDVWSVRSLVTTATMTACLLSPLVIPWPWCAAFVGLQGAIALGSLTAVTGHAWPDNAQVSLSVVSVSLFFVCGIQWLLSRAAALDRARTEEHLREASLARAAARQSARRQVDDFIHDHILSALSPLATGRADDALVREAARSALDSLDRRAEGAYGRPPAGPVDTPRVPTSTSGPAGLDLAVAVETPAARFLFVLLIASSALQALGSSDLYVAAAPVVAAIALLAVAAGLVTWSWPGHRVPVWVQVLLPLIVGGLNALCLWAVERLGWPGYGAWSLGAGTAVCWALLLRRRPLSAWTGYALLVASTVAWVGATGQPFALALRLLYSHLISMAGWAIISIWSDRLVRWISQSDRRAGLLALAGVRQHQMELETSRRMASVDRRARPVLQRALSDPVFVPGLREEAGLLDAQLRDEIRAGVFTATTVPEAAREARRRGVDVVLIDDHGEDPLPDQDVTALIEHVRAALDRARAGRVVIRVLPTTRPHLASIMADGRTDLLPRGAAPDAAATRAGGAAPPGPA